MMKTLKLSVKQSEKYIAIDSVTYTLTVKPSFLRTTETGVQFKLRKANGIEATVFIMNGRQQQLTTLNLVIVLKQCNS